MRYVVFTLIGLLFALTALVAGYNRLSQSQQQHLLCFTHAADDLTCKDWGWLRL